jgi:hypothetical protein
MVSNSSRWWEYYAVRYFIGTVIGAIAVVVFGEFSNLPINRELFPAISNFKEADAQQLLVILALGLTYCYVASAPILALHALRGEIDFGGFKKISSRFCLFVASLIGVALAGSWLLTVKIFSDRFFGMLAAYSVFALQISLLIFAFCGNFTRVAEYYRRLSVARATSDRAKLEYIESYRHLREHGNAFAIVILEVCLAMAAVAAPTITALAILFFLWMLPAAFVWVIGTVLESKLVSTH